MYFEHLAELDVSRNGKVVATTTVLIRAMCTDAGSLWHFLPLVLNACTRLLGGGQILPLPRNLKHDADIHFNFQYIIQHQFDGFHKTKNLLI